MCVHPTPPLRPGPATPHGPGVPAEPIVVLVPSCLPGADALPSLCGAAVDANRRRSMPATALRKGMCDEFSALAAKKVLPVSRVNARRVRPKATGSTAELTEAMDARACEPCVLEGLKRPR